MEEKEGVDHNFEKRAKYMAGTRSKPKLKPIPILLLLLSRHFGNRELLLYQTLLVMMMLTGFKSMSFMLCQIPSGSGGKVW